MSTSTLPFQTTFVEGLSKDTHKKRMNRETPKTSLNNICVSSNVRDILEGETMKHHQIGRHIPTKRQYSQYNFSGLIDAACTDAGVELYSTIKTRYESLQQQQSLNQPK